MSVIEAVPDSDMPPKEREPAPSSGRLRRIARTLLVNAAQLGIVGLAATFLMFVLLRTIPGDPARTVSGPGGSVSPEQIARIRSELGLDKPVVVQYFDWLSAAARGDLGKSLVLKRLGDDLTVRPHRRNTSTGHVCAWLRHCWSRYH